MATIFPKTATENDFDVDSSQQLDSGEFRTIAELQVPAQQAIAWGNGFIQQGVDDRGTITVDVKNSSANNIAGDVRLVVSDADGTKTNFLRESRSEDTRSGDVEVGESLPYVQENSKLELQYRPDSNDTLSRSDSTLRLPLTKIVGSDAEEVAQERSRQIAGR